MQWTNILRHASRAALGLTASLVATTSTLAQISAKPMEIDYPLPVIKVDGPPVPLDSAAIVQYRDMSPKGARPAPKFTIRQYESVVHGVALRGITLIDSTAVKNLIIQQLDEFRRARYDGKIPLADTSEVAQTKVRQFATTYFQKHIPELRPLLPADQQATFDRNVKALEASNYELVNRITRHHVALASFSHTTK